MVGRCPRARGYGVTPNVPLFFIVSLFDVYDTLCNFETTRFPIRYRFSWYSNNNMGPESCVQTSKETLDGHVRRILWEQVPP